MNTKSHIHSLSWTQFFPYAIVRLGGLPVSMLSRFQDEGLEEICIDLLSQKKKKRAVRQHLLQELDAALLQAPLGHLRTTLYNARKRFYQKKNVLWERILPELHADTNGWSTRLVKCIYDVEKSEIEVQAQEAIFQKKYKTALDAAFQVLPTALSERFRLGLCGSSRSLAHRASTLSEKPLVFTRKKDRQTALGLWQNIARVSTKTSPRGTWGPVSILSIENWSAQANTTPPTYAPNAALLDLIYGLLMDSCAFHLLHPIRLNPSLQLQDAVFQFLDYTQGVERMQRLESDEVLQFLYETIQEPMLYKRIAKRIVKLTGTPKLECMHYVEQLLDAGFFVWEKPEVGLDAYWASRLVKHITTLTEHPSLSATREFLEYLHDTAQKLPFATAQEYLKLLPIATQKLKKFAAFFEIDVDGLNAEALWYADYRRSAEPLFDKAALQDIKNRLAAEVQALWRFPLSQKQQLAYDFFKKNYAKHESPSLLNFLQGLTTAIRTEEYNARSQTKGVAVESAPIGAVLQPFLRSDGTLCAVLNGLHIGGGKLMNRFVPLASSDMAQTLFDWLRLDTEVCWATMGWHSSYNANFRPELETCVLDIPAGKITQNSKAEQIPLSEIQVRLNAEHQDHIELVWARTGMLIRFFDSVPEAPNSLPLALQYVRALGMPYVSKEIFERRYPPKQSQTVAGWLHTGRQFLDAEKRIVLRRAGWEIPTRELGTIKGVAFFLSIRVLFERNGLPTKVFFFRQGEKPQFLDVRNPLSVLLFEKYIRKTEGVIHVEECLPDFDALVFECDSEKVAAEVAIEFRI